MNRTLAFQLVYTGNSATWNVGGFYCLTALYIGDHTFIYSSADTIEPVCVEQASRKVRKPTTLLWRKSCLCVYVQWSCPCVLLDQRTKTKGNLKQLARTGDTIFVVLWDLKWVFIVIYSWTRSSLSYIFYLFSSSFKLSMDLRLMKASQGPYLIISLVN